MKNPAFQFYPADYLADAKVQAMSIAGEGCYIRLMSYCWREGSIPSDRSAIARLCKGYDGPGIDEALECFIPSRNLTKLIHKRLESERAKQKRFAKSCHDRGLDGANKRWLGHSSAIATPMAKNGSSSSSSSSPSGLNPPLPPSRGGTRKSRSLHLGDPKDPTYRENYEKRKAQEAQS